MRPHRPVLRGDPLIRPGTDADAPRFISLIERCWYDYPGCDLYVDQEAPELRHLATYYRDQNGALWVDNAGDGMIATRPLEHGTWEICRVYVRPHRHGDHLGRTLLDIAERHAIASGATELALWTDTRFIRAHRFYEKHGYVRAGPLRALDDIARSIEFRYAKPVGGILRLDAAAAQSAERRLAEILCACVDDGASLSFFAPLAADRAREVWRGVTSAVASGNTILLAAWSEGTLVGTVQILLHTAELGRHRAEIGKFMVDPSAQGQGIGRALLAAAEDQARAAGRTLLLLDTRPGDRAEDLYRRAAWQEVGRIADYTSDAQGRHGDTVIFSKRL